MLYAILTRTYLWLYWFVSYRSLEESEFGCGEIVDCEHLLGWMDDFLQPNFTFDYFCDQYDKF